MLLLRNPSISRESTCCFAGHRPDRLPSGWRQDPTALAPLTAALDQGDDALELLRQVLSDFELEILETAPVEYRCYCSRERVSRALISMGRDELEKLIAEQHGAELTCQFCDRVYQFTEEELQSLLDEATEK